MTVAELLARARAQIGSKARAMPEPAHYERAIYQLGAGALDPSAKHPWGDAADGACDCSAFACWCLRLSKLQRSAAWLKKLNGGWLNTGGIWWDARFEQTGWFEVIGRPLPGCVVVYPSSALAALIPERSPALADLATEVGKAPKVGHVGIVTEVVGDRASKVIHSSSGNYRRTGDAIQETGPDVFDRVPATIYAWCSTVEREA